MKEEAIDDAISRSETIKYLNDNMVWYDGYGELADDDEKLKAITDLVNGVPSVTLTRNKGHWKRTTDAIGHFVWECDICEWQQRFATNYCPDCGAEMEIEE